MSTYAVITDTELKALAQAKVSGLAFMVYTALRTHSRNSNNHVFPSIGRLKLMLGDVFSRRSIHRALKRLEISGLIQINSKESKSRFILLAMKVKEVVEKAANEVKSCMRPNRTTMRPNRPYKQRKKERNNYYIKTKRGPTDYSPQSQREPEEQMAPWPKSLQNSLQRLLFATTLGVEHHMAFGSHKLSPETIKQLHRFMHQQHLPVFGEEQDKKAKSILKSLITGSIRPQRDVQVSIK